VLCAYLRERAIAFEDLGFRDATPQGPRSERVYVRGFDGYDVTAVTSTV
jgi:hypothetical protein